MQHLNRFKTIIITTFFLLSAMLSNAQLTNNGIQENLIPFQNAEKKWGYLDAQTSTVAIAPKYDWVYLFENGIAKVSNTNPKAKDYDDNGLVGFINTTGKEIFPPQFTGVYDVQVRGDSAVADSLSNVKYVYVANNQTGVVDIETGQWLIPPSPLINDVVFYSKKSYLINKHLLYDDGKKYEAPIEKTIDNVDFENHLFKIKSAEENTGLCTWEGRIIVPAKYLNLSYDAATKRVVANGIKGGFTLDNFKKLMKTDKNGEGNDVQIDLYDFNGKRIARYYGRYQADISDDHTSSYQSGNKEFVFNLSDGKIITPKAKEVETLENGFVLFEKDNLVGLKDKNNQIRIQPIYRNIQYINPNLIIAQTRAINYEVLNSDGKKVFPDTFSQLTYLSTLRRFMACKGDGCGQIDLNGHVMIPLQYGGFSSLSLIQEPPYVVYKDGKNGIIDSNGNTLVPFEYNDIRDSRISKQTNKTFFVLEKNEHYGLMDENLKWLLPLDYGYISVDDEDSSNNWVHLEAYPRNQNLYGLYNIKNKTVIVPKYNLISAYPGFVIVANRNDNDYTYQLLDEEGKALTQQEYSKMEYIQGAYLLCRKDGKYGVLDTKGNILIPFNYDYLWDKTTDLLVAQKGNNYFYIDTRGREYNEPGNN